MSEKLNKQELHNLAMNIVGKQLETDGYEFLGVNSKLKRDPQFVALKDKTLHFIIVRAISYPQDAHAFDPLFMQTIKEHAAKFEAKTFYAGVGLGHGTDYGKPVIKNEDYTVVYKGLQEIH
ncbi:Na(+)-translocating NADH-quinone reductase subunit F [Aequorivita sp. F47161]|uniref:Na(+)-translocating NADH-quinone reductase subunit F n=1 Tax=Aequorivita vitellina TaxID=2874475 RepID=A0A9X1QRT8_9FLAO|nr:Na(+)-translocating NADH-quinone reductase subunit F [Aequorivita vitellina]MCG2418181.1 Na(+)-translocating NADH-quinone reductase subunit F [Aequorivita vitellina]MCZ4318066.1 Na(+)-translocating NADH-quinone reductase subunit F [Aequorivita viscosa]